MEFPQQFGKYTLLKKLATGGMAEIFLARQAGMGGFEKDVVVKRLLPEHAANQELVSMFLDEARIAAHLTHPAITQIYDLGTQGDSYYIAMEFVHGVDLRRLCSQGIAEGNFLSLNHAIRIIAEVCDALAYAHARTDSDGRPLRIVHRDISPTNILVTFDGGVKLVDFGIAKAANKATVTRAGQIKGKFGYMSPEQVRGEEIDARSDLFAMGINLYEITLGRRLFRGDTDLETMKIIEECVIPLPRDVDPNYPEALERIAMRSLARDPADRFQSARDLQMALEDFLASAGLRSTAGMLAEYMQRLFREQLEIDAQEAPALRAAARTMGESEPPTDATAQALPPMPSMPPVQRGAVSSTYDADSMIRDRDAVVMRLPVGPTGDRPPPTPAAHAPPAPEVTEPVRAVPRPHLRQATLDPLAMATPIGFLDAEATAPPPSSTPFVVPTDMDARMRQPRRYFALVVLLLFVATVAGVLYLGTQQAPLGNQIARALPVKRPGSQIPMPVTEPPPPKPVAKQAVLRLTSEPPGARVVVNGNVLEGVTPTTVQTFAGMKSTVRMLLPKHMPVEQRVDVAEAGLDLTVPLTLGVPPTAALRVETGPVGASVAVNGTEVGVSPLALARVAAGTELSLRITHPGHYPHVASFLLAAGEERELGIQLIPDTGPRDEVVVNVETIPGGATVSILEIDGAVTSLGKTGRYPMKIKDRKFGEPLRLRAEAPGYLVTERDLDLREPFYTVYLRLPEAEKFYGALSLVGAKGLTVYVGPKEVGLTPLEGYKLAEGEHTVVVFDQKSRARQEFKVQVERDKTQERVVVADGIGIRVQ